jgi:hypothetical protein
VELTCDCLTWHQTALTDQKSTIRIESGDSKHDLLGAVFEHPLLTLLEEAEEEAHSTGEKTLKIVLARVGELEGITLPDKGR